MAWYDFFRRFLPKRTAPPIAMRALPSGRASVDDMNSYAAANWVVMPPNNYESNWQLLNFSSKDFDSIAPTKLLEMLVDLSPEVSRAHYDFLRMCNPGFEVKVTRLGSDTPDKRGQAATDEFVNRLNDRYGTLDVVIGRIFTGAFMRGALCAELVLDKRGRMPLDLATPDPASIRFRRRSSPDGSGDEWQPGQWQAYEFKALDIPTFRYIPVDPMPSTPYGRPLAAPTLFTSLFLLGVMHDLKRVIQQQGYPRIDLSIDVDKLLASAPHLAQNPESFNALVGDLVDQVSSAYAQLQPDDAYIHTSNVNVNRPVGAVDSSSLAGIDSIITALERMSARASKTMPLLLGITESTGDVQSTRQYEIFVTGIKSIQHYAETMLNRLFTLALEAQGIQAKVSFVFAELRAAEMLRDAQTETMQINNEREKRNQGWITQDEASIAITGTPAVEEAPTMQAPAPPEIQQGDGEGMEVVRSAEAFLAELRVGRTEVAEALEVVRTNGYHKPD